MGNIPGLSEKSERRKQRALSQNSNLKISGHSCCWTLILILMHNLMLFVGFQNPSHVLLLVALF